MTAELEVQAIREKAFRNVVNDPIEWRKWNDAKTEYYRELLLTKQVIGIVAEECIAEIRAADRPEDAVDAIRKQFGVE